MHAQVSRCGNATNEEEQCVGNIKSNHKHWVEGKVGVECCRYQVEERQHSEHRHEHVIIHNRVITGESGCDHVSDESYDEESPEEL